MATYLVRLDDGGTARRNSKRPLTHAVVGISRVDGACFVLRWSGSERLAASVMCRLLFKGNWKEVRLVETEEVK